MTAEEEREVRSRIADTVRDAEFTETEAWNDLSVLSNNTIVDTVEVFEDEIRIQGDAFEGPLLWHVTLEYGGKEGGFSSADSYPGRFSGEYKNGEVILASMTADTSSFYD